MSDGLNITLKTQVRHFYVKGPALAASARLGLGDRCARKGCGRPAEHPIHLRPPGDAPAIERKAATG